MDNLVDPTWVYSVIELERARAVDSANPIADLFEYSKSRDSSKLKIKPDVKVSKFHIRALTQSNVTGIMSVPQASAKHRGAFIYGCTEIEGYADGKSAKPTLPHGKDRKIWNEAEGDELDEVCAELGHDVIDEIGQHILERARLGKRYRGTVPYAVPQLWAPGLVDV
jgi:hypothetical protein